MKPRSLNWGSTRGAVATGRRAVVYGRRANFREADLSHTNPRIKSKSTVGRTYEWFLELPTPMVLLTMWVAGMLLIGSLVGLLYLLWSSLLTVAATS
jgi:hypothetical protein